MNQNTSNILATGVSRLKHVDRVRFGPEAFGDLQVDLADRRSLARGQGSNTRGVFLVDHYFTDSEVITAALPIETADCFEYVDTTDEPTTTGIDDLTSRIVDRVGSDPCFVVGIGGGTTMDTAKAVSNLLGNGGKAADYQGWDLVPGPGVYKIGVPTLSGTGAEATRTCVMINETTGLKLGMNSHFTVYDSVILDHSLTATVPRNQYFYSGMDAYIHAFESLQGGYRNPLSDAFSQQCIVLTRGVFESDDMMEDSAREQLMVASYLGGVAIGASYVGVLHPVSAALSVVLGIHHCEANCIAMRGMERFYPQEYEEFWRFADKQGVEIRSGVARDLSDQEYRRLIDSTVVHEKPLTNALGPNFRSILTDEAVVEVFRSL